MDEHLSLSEKKEVRRKAQEIARADVLARREAILQESEEAARKQTLSRRSSNGIMNIVLLISSMVFVVCILEITWYYYKGYQYSKQQDEIVSNMDGGIASNVDLSSLDEPGFVLGYSFPDEGDYTIVSTAKKRFSTVVSDRWKEQYRYLSSANPDCFGYIEIPDTRISLPVMFTPKNIEYYLYRNFSGSYETRGTPFLDKQTKLGESQNYIIYAHNMHDGSAFGTLPEYMHEDYYNEHKYIYFNTAISEGVYEIFAVCKTQIYSISSGHFRYHTYGGVLTKDEFELYVKEIKKMSRYKSDLEVVWGDELITLSTCYHDQPNDDGRLIIVAKRIK
ncbi:MAG: class B sortase [Lachnospiraceae bacterium]|nr:class B sortase [Lachnospiraceae bacterium]